MSKANFSRQNAGFPAQRPLSAFLLCLEGALRAGFVLIAATGWMDLTEDVRACLFSAKRSAARKKNRPGVFDEFHHRH
jgi:hypothetical protein